MNHTVLRANRLLAVRKAHGLFVVGVRHCSSGGGDAGGTQQQQQHRPGYLHRRKFQPFSKKEEDDLVRVITTKPRHVLKHVRQLVWKTRKHEMHFRNMVTHLMILLQEQLRKQILDPTHASIILEGVMAECVKLGQHDMAHLLFRAFLRFRKYGCKLTVTSLRHLFDSYKGTDNNEMMQQLALELREDPELRAFCIAAYLFAGKESEAEALRKSIPVEDIKKEDLVALVEGYSKVGARDKMLSVFNEAINAGKLSPDDSAEVCRALLKILHRNSDPDGFEQIVSIMREKQIPADNATFATILRQRMRHSQSIEEIQDVEAQLKADGYTPDIQGNSIIISAYARLSQFNDQGSEEVMLAKVDTLLSSIETRLQQGDPEMDVSAAHLRAVIRGYGAAGKPELMKDAFNRMKHKGLSDDTRVYNEVLKWFSLMGNVKEVLATKDDMQATGVHADSQTYHWLFRSLGKWYPRQVEALYSEMKAARVRPDIFLYTTLVSTFGELMHYEIVEEVVAEVRRREESNTIQVSPHYFTALIRSYAEDLEKATAFYKEAQDKSLGDHEFVVSTYVHVLVNHPEAAELLEKTLQGIKVWNVHLYNVLLSHHSRQNDKVKFAELVESMTSNGVEPNDVTFGTLVTAYGHWQDVDKIQAVMEMMKKREGQVNARFYSILAAAYNRIGDMDGVNDAWDDLAASKLFPDTEVYNSFLALYGRNHSMDNVQKVMNSMMEKVPPNPLTATTIIDLLGKSGRITDMEQVMRDMQASPNLAPTMVTFHQVMNAYAKTGDIAKMEKTREDMLAKGFEENFVTYNILAEGYGRARRFESLTELLEKRKAAGIAMEEIGYCVLITAYARVRLLHEVAKIAEELLQGGAEVRTKKVCWSFIDAFCRCNESRQLQQWMDMLPNPTTSDKMSFIQYYCRAGNLDRVTEMMNEMEKSGHELTYSVLNATARGFARALQFEKTVEILHKMRDRHMVPDASTTMALSSSFLKAGLHEQAQQIVQWRRQYARSTQEEEPENVIV